MIRIYRPTPAHILTGNGTEMMSLSYKDFGSMRVASLPAYPSALESLEAYSRLAVRIISRYAFRFLLYNGHTFSVV